MAWALLSSTILDASGDLIASGSIDAKECLAIQYYIKRATTGDQNVRLTFNSDSTASYSYRTAINGTTDSTGTAQNNVELHSGVVNDNYGIIYVANQASVEKMAVVHVAGENAAGSTNAPDRRESVLKWANTSDAITSVQLKQTSTGDFESTSFMTIFGTDD